LAERASWRREWTRLARSSGCGLRERQRRKYSFIAKLDATFGTEGSYALRVKRKVGNSQREA
jgi:hypothetical protein